MVFQGKEIPVVRIDFSKDEYGKENLSNPDGSDDPGRKGV